MKHIIATIDLSTARKNEVPLKITLKSKGQVLGKTENAVPYDESDEDL